MSEARHIYLDHNATAPLRPEVGAAMAEALGMIGNPSSVHRFGQRARQAIERARGQVADLIGAAADRIVFTSGGTEANNLALHGHRPVIVSAIEHDSVLAAAPGAARICVGADGIVDIDHLDALLSAARGRAIVSVMLANNETGVIQPIADVVSRARAHGAVVHCDAVQGPGKLPLDMATIGIDALSLSAHKFGGPMGIGALALAEGFDPSPSIVGGGQEHGRRAGTENLPGIVGFGAAAALARDDHANAPALARLRDGFERAIKDLAPAAKVFGGAVSRLANTSCVTMPGVSAETQVMALDLAGIAVSAGSACSAGKVTKSHVLNAMGAADSDAVAAIRVSLGRDTTADDIAGLVAAWRALYERAGTPAQSAA